MSGTATDLGVKIGVDGLPQFEAAFNQLESRLNTTAGKQREYEQATLLVQRAQEGGKISAERASQALSALQTRYETQGRALNQLATANDNVAQSSNRMAFQVQNAAFQVGDLGVQVASGQSAVTALAQQLPQLLGGFGVVGAVAGATVAIGAVILKLVQGADAAKEHAAILERLDKQYSATTSAAEAWAAGLDVETTAINRLRDAYKQLTPLQRAYEERRVQAAGSEAAVARGAVERQALDATSGLRNSVEVYTYENTRTNRAFGAAGLPLEELPRQIEAVQQAFDGLRLSTAAPSEAMLEFTQRMTAARDMGGPLTTAITEVVPALDKLRPSLIETDKTTDGVNRQFYALRDQAGPGAVGALADIMRAAEATKTPFAVLQQSVADTNARLQALRTGGLDALKAATDAQTDAAKIRKTENELAQAEALRLQQTVQDEGERTRLFQEGAAERKRAATEAVQAERNLVTETEKAEAAKRDAEQRARAAVTAGRRANSEAMAQERAEAQALARVWEGLRRDGQSGLLVGSENDVIQLRAIRDAARGSILDPKEVEKRAKETKDLLAKQEEEAKRTTDDVVRYGSDLFADMFIETEGGWSRMWSNMRRTAIGVLARIAAEAVIRPIIAPIIGAPFGGGASATGGAAASGGAAGGLSSFLGLGSLGSSLSQALGLGSISEALGLGGLSGGLGGISLFGGTAAGAASTGAATALAAGGDFLGAGLAATTGTAGVTLGSLAGGVGLGFGAGSLLNSLVGGKQTGGMVGSGVGALAGAGLGFLLGGPAGVLLGGLAGGAGGGLLGGLFGPGAPNPAASVQYGGNGTGLSVTGSKSKWMDDAEAIAAVEASLQKINDTVIGLGLRIDTETSGQVHFGKDKDEGTDQRNLTMAVLGGLRGGSDSVMKVIATEIAKGAEANLETAFANINWTKSVYDPLTATVATVSQFEQSVTALRTTWGDAITKATELGLATDVLAKKQQEAVDTAIAQRDQQYANTRLGLQARLLTAQGDTTGAALINFDIQANQQREALKTELTAQGAYGEAYLTQWQRLEDVLWTERKKTAEQGLQAVLDTEKQAREAASGSAASAIGSLADYARSLSFGEGSPLSAQDQFSLAQRQFNAVSGSAVAGDANSISQLQSFSQTYLQASRSLYGSGEGYQQAFQRVQDALGQVGGLSPDTLTNGFLALQNGQQDMKLALVDQLKALLDAVNRLGREQQMTTAAAAIGRR